MTKQFTIQFLKNVKEPKRYYDSNNSGLIFHVRKSGRKSWEQRLRVRGKQIELGLGPFDSISLAEARSLASKNKLLASKGIDPRTEREPASGKKTFQEVTEEYLPIKLAELTNQKHIEQWQTTLRTLANPKLGSLHVDEIIPSDVQDVLSKIWIERYETARRLRGRIENVLNYAIAKGYRSPPNPAAWDGNLSMLLPKIPTSKEMHQPALKLTDAKRWWTELKIRDGSGARALAVLMLSASRSIEVRGMQWNELQIFDEDEAMRNGFAGIWTRPAGRMKEKRTHRVPLSNLMLAFIGDRNDTKSKFVFPSSNGGMLSDMTLNALMKRIHKGDLSGFTDANSGRVAVPHGLRSTFRDWAAENEHSREAAELQLDHKFGSSVEHAYYRTDLLEKRAELMKLWEYFLETKNDEERET
jgi:integrase